MELDNVYNSVYNATLNITVSATFTMANRRNPAAAGLQAPDVVLPISSLVSSNNTAGWFTLSSPTAVATVPVVVPTNAHRAVLEVYASGHGCDEFWYSVSFFWTLSVTVSPSCSHASSLITHEFRLSLYPLLRIEPPR